MHLSSISKSIRSFTLAGIGLIAAHGVAQATAGVWDSAALGYSGNG